VWFDKALLSEVEGLTTNEINYLPFVLSVIEGSLSTDLFRTSLGQAEAIGIAIPA
jgi:hypothetical protein